MNSILSNLVDFENNIKTNCHKLELPYPISTNNYYRKYKNIIVLSKKGKNYKENVYLLFKQKFINYETNINNKYIMFLDFYPKMTKNGQDYKKRLDVDNFAKCSLDSLNGLAYFDDKQIIKLNITICHSIKNGQLNIFWKEI